MLGLLWAQIYQMFSDRVEEIHLTTVQTNNSGDVKFPEWNRAEWSEEVIEKLQSDSNTNTTLHIPSGLGDNMNFRDLFAILGGSFRVYVGVLHFTDTQWFEPIVPNLGSAEFWVIASGVVEILVGIMLIIPSIRWIGGYSSACLLICLYPANLYMWVNSVELGDGASLSQTGNL